MKNRKIKVTSLVISHIYCFDSGDRLALRDEHGGYGEDGRKLFGLKEKGFDVAFDKMCEYIYYKHFIEEHSPILILPAEKCTFREFHVKIDETDELFQYLKIKFLKKDIKTTWEIRVFPTGVISCRLNFWFTFENIRGSADLSDISKLMCLIRLKTKEDKFRTSFARDLAKKVVKETLGDLILRDSVHFLEKPRYTYSGLEFPYPIAIIHVDSTYRSAKELYEKERKEIAKLISTCVCYKQADLSPSAVDFYASNDLSIENESLFLFNFTGGLILRILPKKSERKRDPLLDEENILRTCEITLTQGFALQIYDNVLDGQIKSTQLTISQYREMPSKEMILALDKYRMDFERDREEISGNITKMFGSVSHQKIFQEVARIRLLNTWFELVKNKIDGLEQFIKVVEGIKTEEHNLRVSSAMRILQFVFSGAVGLSVSQVIRGGTISGFTIDWWLALVIGLVVWAAIAFAMKKFFARAVRK
jgi:hypothetical protein